MNKRFFTLMAAVMLAGSPFASEAFAAVNHTAVALPAGANKLANGLKFKIESTAIPGEFYKAVEVTDASGAVYMTKGGYTDTETTSGDYNEETAQVFEVRNVAATTGGYTFELYVGKKKFAVDASGNAVNSSTAAADVKTQFAATDDNANVIAEIILAKVGGATTVIPTADLVTVSATAVEGDLNANLSGRGFKFSFPSAKSQPENNPFADQMIAVNAYDVAAAVGATPAPLVTANDVCFVLANEAGKKLLGTPTADDYKAATYVAISPVSNFGITGLAVANAAGQGFMTIEGKNLATTNSKKADGSLEKVNFENAVFQVTEDDILNAEEEYTLKSTGVNVYKDASNQTGDLTVYTGAYSLMAGGLKTFITTKATSDGLAKAQTGGNTYVQAADLLKTSGPAIYNIYFTGSRPTTSTYAYGKYLVAEIAGAPAAAYATNVYAPAYVDLKQQAAQWVVTDVSEKGSVTFQNAYSPETTTVSAKLYKTSQANVYEISSDNFGLSSTVELPEYIQLVPATSNNTFLTLSDEQLKQELTLSFTDDQNVNVTDLYMFENRFGEIIPNKKVDLSWNVEKASTAYHVVTYAYLKNNEVVSANDTTKVQTYYLVDPDDYQFGLGQNTSFFYTKVDAVVANADKAPTAAEKANAWKQFAFKRAGNGLYNMIEIAESTLTPSSNAAALTAAYGTNIAGVNANRIYADVASSDFWNMPLQFDVTFDVVKLSFADPLADFESLPAEPRYATLDSEEGAISLKENKNGIIEGIVAAEGLTFWLDTANTADELPMFYISKGIAADTTTTKAVEAGSVRNFLYYPADSAYYWSSALAKNVSDPKYTVDGTKWTGAAGDSDLKAIFRPAALANSDTLNTVAGGKDVVVTKKNGLNNFKFYIAKNVEDEGYKVYNAAADVFLYNLNGKLAFTDDPDKALVVTVGEGDPTANEAIAAEAGVQVIGGQGVVTVQGAAGKVVTVANILGQTIANQVAASDNVTIAAPAGIVVVSVDGEATKVIVK